MDTMCLVVVRLDGVRVVTLVLSTYKLAARISSLTDDTVARLPTAVILVL